MTFTTVAAPRAYAGSPRRGPITRLLEDERWLALLLLLPTVVLLGLFIAYPFVKGIMLSVTDTRVGVPGHFVGLQNFQDVWNDSIFRVAVWNTCVYTFVATIFKLALGLWLAVLLNQHFKGQDLYPRVYFAAVHHSDRAVDPRLEVDVRPDLQRHQLDAVPDRGDPQPDQLAGRPGPGADLGDHRQYLARRAVLRDQPARRACRRSAPNCTRPRRSTAPGHGSALSM